MANLCLDNRATGQLRATSKGNQSMTKPGRRCRIAILAAFAMSTAAYPSGQPLAQEAMNEPLTLDATAPFTPAGPADYQAGSSRAPNGSTIGVTNRYLTLDGQPWLPVMGEMHFSRVPESEWEADILRMKSAGVNIISTYIIWIHHEEIEGQWDWTGQRDLRHFAELCQKHGMLLYPRIGPWAHAEARNGGLPDWVVAGGPTRQLDPKFMAETKTLYDQAGEQLRGLLWKDGGPVIGVQIENEYAARGTGQGAEYILALKQMAIASGFDVPLYTVTGWDNAVVPPHAFLPVYGGYPDAPWGSSRTALPPQEVYAFRFGSRVSGSMGMIGAAGGGAAEMAARPLVDDRAVPFLTAEIGGGMQDTYHRRLILDADDIAAMMPVMIGSGVNLYGIYMFAGGQNPQGRLTTLQESQATHYPTDVPEKSYDFQAPIGEYGLERPSLRLLKNWDYFLNDFGSLLAPMPAFAPAVLPKGPTDLSVLRWSVRTDGQAGFLFVNNYVRGTAMPARPQTRFTVLLPGGRKMQLPGSPIDIPSGAYFAWPFGLDLKGVPLRYATAQLLTRLDSTEGTTFVFSCVRGMRCEVALEGERLALEASGGLRVDWVDGATIVSRPAVGATNSELNQIITVRTSKGASVRLLLLSPATADNTWKLALNREPGLLETTADVFADKSSVTLRQLGDPAFHFTLYPAPASVPVATVPVHATGVGRFFATLPKLTATVATTLVKQAASVPPVALGQPLSWRPIGVAEAPSDATWTADAARWSLNITPPSLPPASQASGIDNLFLRIAYAGDAARIESDGKLLDDDFFNGEPWLLGLRRYALKAQLPPLELEILPMRSDTPVYLPPAGRAELAATAQTMQLKRVTVTPQYQLKLTGSAARP